MACMPTPRSSHTLRDTTLRPARGRQRPRAQHDGRRPMPQGVTRHPRHERDGDPTLAGRLGPRDMFFIFIFIFDHTQGTGGHPATRARGPLAGIKAMNASCAPCQALPTTLQAVEEGPSHMRGAWLGSVPWGAPSAQPGRFQDPGNTVFLLPQACINLALLNPILKTAGGSPSSAAGPSGCP